MDSSGKPQKPADERATAPKSEANVEADRPGKPDNQSETAGKTISM
jgi:hypothetical protein